LERENSESSLKTLIKNGNSSNPFQGYVNRIPEEEPEKEPPKLSTSQEAAFLDLKTQFERESRLSLLQWGHRFRQKRKSTSIDSEVVGLLAHKVLFAFTGKSLDHSDRSRLRKSNLESRWECIFRKYPDNEASRSWKWDLNGSILFVVGVAPRFSSFWQLGLISLIEEHESQLQAILKSGSTISGPRCAIMLAYFHQGKNFWDQRLHHLNPIIKPQRENTAM